MILMTWASVLRPDSGEPGAEIHVTVTIESDSALVEPSPILEAVDNESGPGG